MKEYHLAEKIRLSLIIKIMHYLLHFQDYEGHNCK